MDWTRLIFDLIDLRSFSNLWYWIALAVAWSSASHWVLGIPYDMVLRARRMGGQAEQDLTDITRVDQDLYGLNDAHGGRLVVFPGGIPLVRDGRIVGAIGVSTGTIEEDQTVAEAGAAAL